MMRSQSVKRSHAFRVRRPYWPEPETYDPTKAAAAALRELLAADVKNRLPLTWRMQQPLLAQLRKAGRPDLADMLARACDVLREHRSPAERRAVHRRLLGKAVSERLPTAADEVIAGLRDLAR